MHTGASAEATSRDRILAEARREFATRGFAPARLQDIGARVGLSHATLLYHFASKEGLYAAVIQDVVDEWAASTRGVITTGLRGFDQMAALLEATFEFFERRPELVAIVRREALDGGDRLDRAGVEHLRPFLDQAVAFLRREMAAGRLREHDPLELMLLCYGAILTPFSDGMLRARLLGEQPADPRALRSYRDGLIAILRAALEPPG